ncbi:MAG: Crp/Fnr family transcriptional regulator, partial [Hyphomonadaceae bacterium]|nr:Crp/Fnr family transcriptional regulator [Hyphomonadaceae bacterium]
APKVVSAAARAALVQAIGERRLTRGEHLFREGDRAQTLYFIQSGLLRYYYLADGSEHTGQFFDEGMFLADVFSLTTDAPGSQNIDALEATVVLTIPRAALYAAYDADHAYERFGRRVMEEVVAGSQRRSASLLQKTPEERYAHFIAARPSVARRVPQYVIASYLGITPEALSRIRRRRAGA